MPYFYRTLLLFVSFGNLLVQPLWAQTRKVLVENITGAWCGFCPDGAYTVQQLSAHFDQIICVSAHVNDPMANPDSEAIGEEYSGGGVNVLMLDRYLFDDEQFVQFPSQYDPIAQQLNNRLAMPAVVGVAIESVILDTAASQLTATVRATFSQTPDVADDLRLNLWVVEDSVVGTANSYNQVNFFNAYAGHAYFGAGNPIPNYTHRNVLRYAAGGAWGTAGSIDNNNNTWVGQTFVYTYTIPLNPTWQLSRLSLVGLVQHYNESQTNREILNAEQISLAQALLPLVPDTTTITDISLPNMPLVASWQCYPNPAKGQMPWQIDYTLEQSTDVRIALYAANGRLVEEIYRATTPQGKHQLTWQPPSLAANGIYTLRLETPQGALVRAVLWQQ